MVAGWQWGDMAQIEERTTMTQAEYARHRGKNPQYINKLVEAGVLVMRGRLVDVAASDAVLDDKPEPLPSRQQPATFAQARPARELFSAKLKKLDYETRIGKLVPTDEVSIKRFTFGQQIRARLLGMPSKLAPQLAAETGAQSARDPRCRNLVCTEGPGRGDSRWPRLICASPTWRTHWSGRRAGPARTRASTASPVCRIPLCHRAGSSRLSSGGVWGHCLLPAGASALLRGHGGKGVDRQLHLRAATVRALHFLLVEFIHMHHFLELFLAVLADVDVVRHTEPPSLLPLITPVTPRFHPPARGVAGAPGNRPPSCLDGIV